MAMLRGYFDDSGTHQAAHAVAIGGFVGEAAQWLGFDGKWCAVLKDYDLDYFHMVDWSNRAPPYSKWTGEEREACLNRLLKIVVDHDLISVGVSIPIAHYDSILSQLAKDRLSPYALASQYLFSGVARHFSPSDQHGKVAYIFERGAPGSAGMKQAFDDSVRWPNVKQEYHLSTLEFAGKREVPALQAADVMAYEIYREMGRPFEKYYRYPLRELGGKIRCDWWRPNEDSLKHFDMTSQWLAFQEHEISEGRNSKLLW